MTRPVPFLSWPVRVLYWLVIPRRMRAIRDALVVIELERIADLPPYTGERRIA